MGWLYTSIFLFKGLTDVFSAILAIIGTNHVIYKIACIELALCGALSIAINLYVEHVVTSVTK